MLMRPKGLIMGAVALSMWGATPAASCSKFSNPSLGAEIDRLLSTNRDPAVPSLEVRTERRRMIELANEGKEAAARELEEKLMRSLGYEKIWLRCGPGVFIWKEIQPRGRT